MKPTDVVLSRYRVDLMTKSWRMERRLGFDRGVARFDAPPEGEGLAV